MTRFRIFSVLAPLGLAAAAATAAAAHHSVAGQFDVSERVTLNGVISGVDWINPHIYVHLDVEGPDGETVTWRLETAPPAMMRRAGLTSAMLMGDGGPVEVLAMPARRENENMAFIQKITYADGHYYLLSNDR